MTARKKRAVLLFDACAASLAVVYIQEKHRRPEHRGTSTPWVMMAFAVSLD